MKAITMTRTLTEIRVKYVRPIAATRTWEELTDRFFVTDDLDKVTKEAVAAVLDLPSPDYVDKWRARRVKATWNLSDIVRKAKLSDVADAVTIGEDLDDARAEEAAAKESARA